tara:strand:- start:459 stop:980 length:522 start_codon:yes stop_codon:yes gene_type:complete
MIIWLVGLSSSGKTTIGKKIFKFWKSQDKATVFIDGDEIRKIFSNKNNDNYNINGRKRNAERIRDLCILLDKNDINAVVSVLSIFPEMLIWNRKNFKKYFEVFLNPTFETLLNRDVKGLYKSAIEQKTKNVVGIDIDFNPPKSPDLILNQEGKFKSIENCVNEILIETGLKKK